MGTYSDLKSAVSSYTTYDAADFTSMIPAFIRSAEERIWYFIQLPHYRKNVSGSFSSGDQYLKLPDDFLAAASLAAISATGDYSYIVNKDVSFMREVYPNPNTSGVPEYYALFEADGTDTTIVVAPTPDAAYNTELHYFYKPVSLTAGSDSGTTWLSKNAYDTLLNGALSEAANWLKKSAGIDDMGDVYEKRFIVGIEGLKTLGEVRSRKDVYRTGEKRRAE